MANIRKHVEKKKAKTLVKSTRKTSPNAQAHKNKPSMIHYSKKYCPNCGNPLGTSEKGPLCKDCRKVDFEFKDITLTLCNSCGSYFHKNKWAKFTDIDKAITAMAKDNIKAVVKINKVDENLKEKLLSYKAGINTDIKLEIVHKGEQFDIPAHVFVTLCKKCSKMGSQYFESVFQLRNASKEAYEFARNDIEKQRSKGIHLNKESRLDKYSEKDVDFFLTNKNYAVVLAEKMKKSFGGTIKKNAQLFSIDWETSKNQYRLNVLVELPSYGKGDVIKIGNDLLKIVSLAGKIHAQNLKTKAKTSMPYKQTYDILKPAVFQVIKKYPEYEVLDPNTYYQARLMNPDETLEINQKIRCVIDGSEAWMI